MKTTILTCLLLFGIMNFAFSAEEICKDQAKAEKNFKSSCQAYLSINNGGSSTMEEGKKFQSECQCVVDNFTVHKMADPTYCSFDEMARTAAIISVDKIKAKCF
jgi:hypothetical protein